MSYKNFRDPIGLVMRMLRSRDAAARAALVRAALTIGATPLDWAMQALERERLESAGPHTLPIFLVVGPPRSGTTLVYQVLARHLPFSYFDNLSGLFPRSPITALHLSGTRFGKNDDSLLSFYGNTRGLRGVNDGFHIWNRWLGEDRYVPLKDIADSQRVDMLRFFAAWSQAFGLPLLNKNNRNTFCVGLLASLLESAVFVVVTRNPVFVAQSLLIARERIHGTRQAGWGLGANGRGHAEPVDPLVDVADQVRFCVDSLDDQLKLVPEERLIRVRYEDFCFDPARHVKQVGNILNARFPSNPKTSACPEVKMAPLRVSDSVQLPQDQFDQLCKLLAPVANA